MISDRSPESATLPPFRVLLRRSFLRMTLGTSAVLAVALSLMVALFVARLQRADDTAALLASFDNYREAVQLTLSNSDAEMQRAVLGILRDTAFITLVRLDDNGRNGFDGYGVSLQLLQHSPPEFVQWIDTGVRYDSATLEPLGPVPEHWREALAGREQSVMLVEPADSIALTPALRRSGARTLLMPITPTRAVAFLDPLTLVRPWDSLYTLPTVTALLWLALATVLALPAMLVGRLLARRDASRLELPLRELADVAEQFRGGNFGARWHRTSGSAEIAMLGRTLNLMGERIEQTHVELRASHDRLAQALESQKRLFADVSHDLRTPLAAILLQAEVARESGDTQSVEIISAEAENLRRLVDDIFAVARLESGQLRLELANFEALPAAVDVAAALKEAAWRRGVLLRVAESTGPSPVVRADPQRLGQVLRNVVTNAVRHTAEGGLIELAVQSAGDSRVRFRVTDTGEGIPPEHLPHVFERFWRGDSSRSNQGSERSTGLGLAIVKELVEAMGGHVEIESELGVGTQVTIELPAA